VFHEKPINISGNKFFLDFSLDSLVYNATIKLKNEFAPTRLSFGIRYGGRALGDAGNSVASPVWKGVNTAAFHGRRVFISVGRYYLPAMHNFKGSNKSIFIRRPLRPLQSVQA